MSVPFTGYFYDETEKGWRYVREGDDDTSHGNRGTIVPLAAFVRVRSQTAARSPRC